MPNEFSGIERRLDELDERLARLQPLQTTARAEFSQDPYLRDIVERNLEVAAQACIDISHRIIALLGTQKPISSCLTGEDAFAAGQSIPQRPTRSLTW